MTSRWLAPFACSLVALAACSTTQRRAFDDAPAADGLPSLGEAVEPPEEDLYANDPPPRWCGPKGGPKAPPAPGGTLECPDDKNKPGCSCDELGKKVACWTGLRANRGLGICQDGMTTCQRVNELENAWGPCEGEVLPKKGVKQGPSACRCFSEGQWHIDAPTACAVQIDAERVYWVSTTQGPDGQSECPPITPGAAPKKPSVPWSRQSIKADCAGQFELCIELRGGDVQAPSPSDCLVTKQCVQVDYLKEGVEQQLPALDGWVNTNPACSDYLYRKGGYAEMSVKGLSVRCDEIDDGNGDRYVFHRWGYCPGECAVHPETPACAVCVTTGADGSF